MTPTLSLSDERVQNISIVLSASCVTLTCVACLLVLFIGNRHNNSKMLYASTLELLEAPPTDVPGKAVIFGSMRFPVPPEARALAEALQAKGVVLKIVDMMAGGDIDREVFRWVRHADNFLVFGCKRYGEDSGNSASSYHELKFAQAKRKNVMLLRMIPWTDTFQYLAAQVIFNQNDLVLTWLPGEPMPSTLVDDLLCAIGLPDGYSADANEVKLGVAPPAYHTGTI